MVWVREELLRLGQWKECVILHKGWKAGAREKGWRAGNSERADEIILNEIPPGIT